MGASLVDKGKVFPCELLYRLAFGCTHLSVRRLAHHQPPHL